MTITSYPFDSSSSYEAQWTKMARLWRPDGPAYEILNKLETYGDSTGMQVKVKTGGAWIKGHYMESSAIETLAIAAADATNPRIDLVVVRLSWPSNTIILAVLTGTPAGSPAVPALTQTDGTTWEIALAQVYVAASVSTITAGNVTDARSLTYLNERISKQIILFGASGTLSTTDGATAPSKIESATNKQNINYPSFPTALKRYIEWDFVMPDDWDGGTITAEFFWTGSGTTTNSVVWGIQGRAYSDGDAIDQAWGSAIEVTDAHTATAYTDLRSAITAAITFAGTLVAGQSVRVRAYRLGSGSDNFAVAALLKCVRLNYTRLP